MRKTNFCQNVDSLIQGIDTIVLKNRCSFSDEELLLIKECKQTLKKFKKAKNGKKPDLNLLVKISDILTRTFIAKNELLDVS